MYNADYGQMLWTFPLPISYALFHSKYWVSFQQKMRSFEANAANASIDGPK